MRKILPIIAVLLFASCSNEAPATADTKQWITRIDDGRTVFRIWQDEETGCQYILYEPSNTSGLTRSGLTPRLNSYGHPMCK